MCSRSMNADLHAELRAADGGNVAAGAGADDEQIVAGQPFSASESR
jgi:hypothetical protein